MSLLPAGVTDWTREACRRVVRDLRAEGHAASHVWGAGNEPDHNNRRCVDFMLPTVADVDWAAAYLTRHASALDVRLIIANRRIWRAYRKGPWRARTWQRYWGRSPHRDHVHAEFAR